MVSESQADRKILIHSVTERTMRWNFRMWGFGEAVALRGLLRASLATGDSEPLGYVKALLRAYAGSGVARSAEEHVAPGAELLLLYELTREDILLEAAEELAYMHSRFPTNSKGARLHRSDLPGWRHQIWVDCMDAEAPFLARLGRITGEGRYFAQAVEELTAYSRLLQDEHTGLFFHGYEDQCGRNGHLWARGNGWALMGLVETLSQLPDEHQGADELRERLHELCRALAEHQHDEGLWHTVVDHEETYLESTLAVMVSVALRMAFAAALLQRDEFQECEKRARSAVLRLVDDDGALALVSDATPIGDLKMYATRPMGVFPWGQGPLLLMLTQS